jgi:hypothetical protein
LKSLFFDPSEITCAIISKQANKQYYAIKLDYCGTYNHYYKWRQVQHQVLQIIGINNQSTSSWVATRTDTMTLQMGMKGTIAMKKHWLAY